MNFGQYTQIKKETMVFSGYLLHNVLFIALVTKAATAPNQVTQDSWSSNDVCTSDGCKRVAKRIHEFIDPTVNPCDDFYKFACGGFIKSTSIPSDKVGVTPYTQINDILQNRLKNLFEEESPPNELTPFRSLKSFYRTGMDTNTIERTSQDSLTTILKELGGWPVVEGKTWNENDFDWKNITWKLKNLGMFHKSFLNFGVTNHPKNSTFRLLAIGQPTLGLNQEILSEGFNNSLVEAYYKFMVNVASIFGANKEYAKQEMLEALKLEIIIARISVPEEKLRDMNLLFNPMTLTEMQQKFPSIYWVEFMNNILGTERLVINGSENINVEQPQFLVDAIHLLAHSSKRAQANYAIWKSILASAPYLNEKILQESLKFDQLRIGVKDRKPRWQECITFIMTKLPKLAGAMYARRHFTPEARDKVTEIIDSLRKVFRKILEGVDWMDDVTKRHALEKADSMITYVGYSDELLDDKILEDYYSSLQVYSDSFLKMGSNITLFQLRKSYQVLREHVGRSDWRTRSTPAVINAFSSLGDNAIEFPAAILQGVYFDEESPSFANYGGVGFLAGHEITHGFDDQGRQYDKDGNLIDWWEKDTNTAYIKKKQCIIDQYSNYTVPEVGLKINGVASQGENIADNGGVKDAYLAYQHWVKEHSSEPRLPGLNYTSNQLFWISAANIWCAKYRPEYTKLLLLTNVHCPNDYRVIGAVQNMNDFAQDFDCPLGSPMNPEKKCTVW